MSEWRFHVPEAAPGARVVLPEHTAHHAREVLRRNQIIREILVRHTSQSLERITHDTDRDFFMSPPEAKEYGIVDEILTRAGA